MCCRERSKICTNSVGTRIRLLTGQMVEQHTVVPLAEALVEIDNMILRTTDVDTQADATLVCRQDATTTAGLRPCDRGCG